MEVRRIAVMEWIGAENCADLVRRLTAAAVDESVSVIVLHGGEGYFCRGLDLGAVARDRKEEEHEDGVGTGLRVFSDLLKTILLLPKPIIAEVDGEALGGGLGLAAACDAVVASRRARFGLPEALFGLAPAIVTPILLQRMMPQKLRFLALCGVAVDAELAQSLGLADVVAEEKELSKAVNKLARDFERTDPQAIPVLRQFIQQSMGRPAAEMISRGAELTASMLREQRVVDAIGGFILEGIAPWVGRRK